MCCSRQNIPTLCAKNRRHVIFPSATFPLAIFPTPIFQTVSFKRLKNTYESRETCSTTFYIGVDNGRSGKWHYGNLLSGKRRRARD